MRRLCLVLLLIPALAVGCSDDPNDNPGSSGAAVDATTDGGSLDAAVPDDAGEQDVGGCVPATIISNLEK